MVTKKYIRKLNNKFNIIIYDILICINILKNSRTGGVLI